MIHVHIGRSEVARHAPAIACAARNRLTVMSWTPSAARGADDAGHDRAPARGCV